MSKPTKARLWCVILPSILFATATVIGRTMDKYDSFEGIKASPGKYAALFLCSGLIFFALAYLLFGYIENSKPAEKSKSEFLSFLFDRKPFFIPFCAFIIAWLPYLVCYPGSPCGDWFSQIETFFGNLPLANDNPVFATFVYGLSVKFGHFIGSDNIAVYALALGQTVSMAAMFAWMLCLLRKIPHIVRFIMFLIFALTPGIALYSIYIGKDFVYALFIALFSVFTYLIIDEKELSPKQLAAFIFVSVMCVLWRNNGIHTIVPVLFIMLFVKGISKKQTASALIAVVLVYLALHKILMPALNIAEGQYTEMMSVPFQQTARYAKFHGNEVTESEKAAIDKVLVYDDLSERYNPVLSDNIKGDPIAGGNVRKPSKSDLADYLRIWFIQMKKHPGTYFAATANNTYGYFYPRSPKQKPHGNKLFVWSETLWAERYNLDESRFVLNLKCPDSMYAKTLSFLPQANGETYILRNFTGVSFFTWIMIAACFFMIKRRAYKYLLVALPSLITLLVCIASPVNGESRYALPYMFCAPFLICLCFLIAQEDK